MATAGSIVIELLAKTGSFETDTARAERSMKMLERTAYKAGETMGASFRTAGALMATGLAAGGAAAVSWTRDVIQLGNELDKLSKLAGTSSTVFQGLAAGANSVGISQEKLADIYKDTQDKIGDFLQTGGGAMKDFFDNIAPKVGVTADQFRKLSGPDALGAYYNALEKAGVSQNELVFFMEAIASDSSTLIPLLKNNSAGMREWAAESAKFGALLDAGMSDDIKELRIESARVELAFQGLKNSVASELLPTMKEFAQLMRSDDFKSGFGALIEGAASATQYMVQFGTTTANVIRFLSEELASKVSGPALDDAVRIADAIEKQRARITAMDKSFGFFGGAIDGYDPLTGANARAKDLSANATQARAELKRLLDLQKLAGEMQASARPAAITAPIAAPLGGLPAPGSFRTTVVDEKAIKAADQLFNTFKSSNAQLERQIALYGQTSHLAEVNYEIQSGALKGLAPDLQAVYRGNASILDIMESMSEVDAYQQEQAEAWGAAFDSMFGGDEGTEEIMRQLDGISMYADQAARNMQDAFADFLFDPFADGVGGMVKGFAEAIQRMLAEAAAAQIFEMVGSWATSYSGSGSGWVNAIGGAVSGGRAGGGSVAGAGMYRIGEGNRPELLHQAGKTYLLPGEAGRIEPITAGRTFDTNSASGPVTVNQTIVVNTDGSAGSSTTSGDGDRMARALAERMRHVAREELIRQSRDGGILRTGR
jgi:hypothetical protein